MEAPLFELVPRAVIWVMFCMVGPGMKSIHQTYQKSGNAQATARGFWCYISHEAVGQYIPLFRQASSAA